MANLDLQVKELTAAVQALIDNSIAVTDLEELTEALELDDIIVINNKSTGTTVRTTVSVFLTLLQTGGAVDFLDFNILGSNPTWSEARIFYDNVKKSLNVYDDQSETSLQVGQE